MADVVLLESDFTREGAVDYSVDVGNRGCPEIRLNLTKEGVEADNVDKVSVLSSVTAV